MVHVDVVGRPSAFSMEPQVKSYGTLTQNDEGAHLMFHAKNDLCLP